MNTESLAPRSSLLAPLKITFLTVMPSPYVQDLFAALADDARVELKVWYLEQVAPDTHWGEQQMPEYAQVLPGKWYGVAGARVHWNPRITQQIQNSDADLFVIVGYIGLTNQVAMRTLNRLGRPWVFWGEIPGFRQRSWSGTQLRSFLQRPLRYARGVAAVGQRAVEAYRQIIGDTNPECVYANIPYHCRLDEFRAEGVRRVQSQSVRFLYCGQLIERKGVDLLCDAFERLVQEGHNVTLALAGEGPLRAALQGSQSAEAARRTNFMGFQPVSALPNIFRDADVFLLPSRHDGWGVVVNQALASGLPVISTKAVGAAFDLIDQSVGTVVDANSAEALYEAMTAMLKQNLTTLSTAAFQRSERVSLEAGCEEWVSFLSSSLATPA